MRISVVAVLVMMVLAGCSDSPQVRAKHYQPTHVKNGVYRFDLSTWPYSLAEFEERYEDSLRVISFCPMYSADGTKVVGMVVLTRTKENAR